VTLLSTKTLGVLTSTATWCWSTSDLKTMLMTSGVWDGNPVAFSNKDELVRDRLLTAREAFRYGDDAQALQDTLEFVRLLALELHSSIRSGHEAKLGVLREALRSDGYELQTGWDSNLASTCRLLPSEPEAAPLSPEITVLERELESRGYMEALGHYQQAVANFADQNHAASNGQLRSALESLIVNLAVDHTGYEKTDRANQGGAAIRSLYVEDGRPPAVIGERLPERDGGAMLQGIWDISHPNGSHPGLSDAQEGRMRMQLITALAQFLLRHFPASTAPPAA